MSGLIGADLEQMRNLARAFEQAANQLTQTSHQVRNGIQISAWAGPFAVRFRHTWDSEHSVKLRQASAALSAQAKQLRLEADQQDRASAAATGASTRPPAKVSDRDLVEFAESGASNKKGITKDGYTQLGKDELKRLGITPGMLRDERTGFDAKVYRDAHGRIIVSFGGTEGDLRGADWTNNFSGANPYHVSAQAEASVALALALKHSVGADNLILTGHSLGGRNAALASVATGARAVTFNAAGVSAGDYLYASTAGGNSVSLLDYAAGTFERSSRVTGESSFRAADNVVNYSTNNDELGAVQDGINVAQQVARVPIPTVAPGALGEQHFIGWGNHSAWDAFREGTPDD
ncbi:Mbeg1-like protein [Nocardioides zhouii]|uniref:DUF2974 domain-containing protein n=1 Tax=Nocardioides zhouii TaxID=1168729 RepID=A0A4Q2SYH8_9ACTN|nr:Mbeg1-like protein [Nocardioides zhouii]RYC11052.1 DUF2974 domain-containing protein [Nocardioides zhouii]